MKMEQLKKRFLLRNPDGLTDAELLELLLSFSSTDPQKLTQDILKAYPTVAQLMEAATEDLTALEGMEQNSVLLLRLVPELHRRYFLSRSHVESRLKDSHDFGHYLLPYYYGARDEMVYLLLLDGVGKVINCRMVGYGSVNSANVPIRRLVQEALNANASGVVVAHNHPNGIALPSKEDISATVFLRDTLDALDILLVDHIIIADDDFISLRESGYLRNY